MLDIEKNNLNIAYKFQMNVCMKKTYLFVLSQKGKEGIVFIEKYI